MWGAQFGFREELMDQYIWLLWKLSLINSGWCNLCSLYSWKDITICCGILMAKLVPRCWASFSQHGIDLQICILYINEDVISQRVLPFKSLAALWEMTVVLAYDCLPRFSYIQHVGWVSQQPSVYNQSILSAVIDVFQDDICFLPGFIYHTSCHIRSTHGIRVFWLS